MRTVAVTPNSYVPCSLFQRIFSDSKAVAMGQQASYTQATPILQKPPDEEEPDQAELEKVMNAILDDAGDGLDEKDKKKMKELQAKAKGATSKGVSKLGSFVKHQQKTKTEAAAKTYKQALGSAEHAFKGAL